jgi:stage III sporulation protein SpoIIIAA
MRINEDLACLIDILPKSLQDTIRQHPEKDTLIEIVMDLGRRPEARFPTHPEYLSPNVITWQDLDYSVKRLSKFADDNRAGIERTLHRISCIRNRQGQIVGLTCRVGRAMCGTINIIRDLLESGKSILILGRPGVGKTTMVREIARVIANEMEKRVVIIDTSNEIAGNSDIPHVGIGRARRMQVSHTDLQHKVMIEAVENHMPEIIIIDEIGTELEALAAQTIAERGVQLIGTAHGNYLGSLIKNPTLSDLVGGIQYVTLSDEEARRRGTQKSILERKGPPAFQLAIEINERFLWTIHEKVEISVDYLLQGQQPKLQVRTLDENGNFKIFLQKPEKVDSSNNKSSKLNKNWRKVEKPKLTSVNSEKISLSSEGIINKIDNQAPLIVFDYSISRNLVTKCALLLKLNIEFTSDLKEAMFVLGLKNHIRDNLFVLNTAKQENIPVYTIQNNSQTQITQILSTFVS